MYTIHLHINFIIVPKSLGKSIRDTETIKIVNTHVCIYVLHFTLFFFTFVKPSTNKS